MNGSYWSLVEMSSRLLAPADREAVLGDLLEADENVFRALFAVVGLFLRQQGMLWNDWRPWLAGFGIAWPSWYLLMSVSGSVTCTYERLANPGRIAPWWWPTGHEGMFLLLCHVFLLLVWSWTSGYVVGALSRRTIWVSAALCIYPVFAATFPIEPLPRVCLFLFLAPAVVGAIHGLQGKRIPPVAALALAMTVTAVMAIAWGNEALWIYNWALIWPVWYLAATTIRPAPVAQPA